MNNSKKEDGVMYFRLDNALKQKLKVYCALHNRSVSALLREFIEKTVKDMPRVTAGK